MLNPQKLQRTHPSTISLRSKKEVNRLSPICDGVFGFIFNYSYIFVIFFSVSYDENFYQYLFLSLWQLHRSIFLNNTQLTNQYIQAPRMTWYFTCKTSSTFVQKFNVWNLRYSTSHEFSTYNVDQNFCLPVESKLLLHEARFLTNHWTWWLWTRWYDRDEACVKPSRAGIFWDTFLINFIILFK